MIQDIAPHIYHNEYCPEKPDADSYLMYFEKHNALARWDGVEIAFPRFRDFPEVKTESSVLNAGKSRNLGNAISTPYQRASAFCFSK